MSNSLMLDITENASKKAKQLLLESNLKPIGIRIGILEGGCSGLSYNVELTGEVKNGDEIVKIQGVTFIIDPAATLFLIGTTVEWQEDKFKSGFVFKNPNETSRCGCGESFSV